LQVSNILAAPGGCLLRVLGKGQTEPRAAPLSQEAHVALMAWLVARADHVDVAAAFTGFYGPKGGWRPIASHHVLKYPRSAQVPRTAMPSI